VPQTTDGPSIRPLGRRRSAVHSFHFDFGQEISKSAAATSVGRFDQIQTGGQLHGHIFFCIDEEKSADGPVGVLQSHHLNAGEMFKFFSFFSTGENCGAAAFHDVIAFLLTCTAVVDGR